MQSPERQRLYFNLILEKSKANHEVLKRRIASSARRDKAKKLLGKTKNVLNVY